MAKIHHDQTGFSAFTIILLVLLVSAIGFAGWQVYSQRATKQSASSTPSVVATKKKATPAAKVSFVLPDGWKWYEDQAGGFAFAYPKMYDPFKEDDRYHTGNVVGHKDAQVLDEKYAPGVTGTFTVEKYKPGVLEVYSRKYGPEIILKGDQWVVSEPAEADKNNQKVGDPYKEFDGTLVQGQKRGVLTFYVLHSGDEGVSNTRLLFVSKGSLYSIDLPAYYASAYNTDSDTPPPVPDEKPHKELIAKILESFKEL